MTPARDHDVGRDAEARRLAQTEYEKPLVIEAGAGTGKTALLVARVVVWCLGPGWAKHVENREPAAVARRVVERVVAITFTDAAAAEMAERVAKAFSTLAEGETPVGVDRGLLEVEDEELKERASLLADEVHRLQAQTIHSWCHHLLRAFPLEAGVHPRFEVDSDGAGVDVVVEEVVAESLRALGEGDGGSDWEILAAAGVTPLEVADAARRFIASGVSGDQLRKDPCSPEAVARMVSELIDALDSMDGAGLSSLAGVKGNTGLVAPALNELRSDLGGAAPENPRVVADALNRLPDKVKDRVKDWARGKFTKTDGDLVPSRPSLTEASSRLHRLLLGLKGFSPSDLRAAGSLLADVVGTAEERLARSGVLSFDALLRLAAGVLEASEGVRGEVRAGMDQLMVDEFQDTDVTQCRLVRSLALSGGEHEPGLFIVGDPKQSIYGWRRADLGAYDRFTAEVEQAGGRVEPLVRNFRSTQMILDEVERLVKQVMVKKEGIQPAFQRLEATEERREAPGFTERGRAPVEHWVDRPCEEDGGGMVHKVNVDDALAIEAAAVAEDIRDLVQSELVEPKEVAILVRSTTSLEPLLDALRSAGVPFEVTREREYYRRREVVETAALVRSIIEPADQLALLTVIRSDAVGVPDAALAPLWDAGLPGIMVGFQDWDGPHTTELDTCIQQAVAAIPADLPGLDSVRRWPAALRTAARTLGLLRKTLGAEPPDIFVERLRTLWLAEATASARYQGRFRRARLERFFAELTAALASDDGSLAGVGRMLRRAVEEGGEPKAPGDPDVTADAVHVMTIHGAKGLDFEHVYLCQIHKGDPGPVPSSTVDLLPSEGNLEFRVFGWPTPGFGAAGRHRRERDLAERVRLLYVATTRAKKRLVVSGRWQSDGELIPAGRARSFEDLMAHRMSPEDMDAQAREGLCRRPEAGRWVHWVLPALDSSIGDMGRDVPGPRPEYDLGRVRREVGRLASRRAEARERSARPMTRPASSLAHEGTDTVSTCGPTAERAAAAAAGTAVHRLMEVLDLQSDLPDQIRSMREEVAEWAASDAGSSSDEARERVGSLLDRVVQGSCLKTLQHVAEGVVARELPVLVPTGEDDGAVSAIVGVADLVYQKDGRLVVADFKTDGVETEDETAERAEHYRPQLELYARAVREGLDLDYLPNMELWFLSADRIVPL